MAHTNSTENYGLPQWIGTDKPTFLGDFNTAFGIIDDAMKDNADAATAATATANSASAVATSANTNASTALNTANQALTDAQSAVTTAGTANTKATQAQTDAANAVRASAANTIENLAPAYDPTLTYQVGDLCTFVDAQNSGRLYKCIVPVNTPMDFNINYWDDVTTSEVYDVKFKTRVFNIDNSISWSANLDAIHDTVAGLIDNDCYLVLYIPAHDSSPSETRFYKLDSFTEDNAGGYITFSAVQAFVSNFLLRELRISTSGSVNAYLNCSASGNTFTDSSSNNPTITGTTLTLYYK